MPFTSSSQRCLTKKRQQRSPLHNKQNLPICLLVLRRTWLQSPPIVQQLIKPEG